MSEYANPQPSAPQAAPAAPTAPPPPPVTTTLVPPVIVDRKSPGLAGFLSMFPGLGHVYLGLYQRAFAIGGAFILGIAFASHGRGSEFFGPIVAFVWFFAIIDAVRQAKAINAGYVDAGGLAASERVARVKRESTAGLTWGVILVGIGTLWLIDRYVDLDWFWAAVEDWLAPVSFILLGLVLIITYVIKKRRHNENEVWPPRS